MTTTSGPRAQLPQRLALGLILLLAAGLRFANLGALGYVNHYYSAGIVSMLQSWHNLFFVAAEPGGAVSIDKPPLGLWIQALSAGLFGVNTFGLLLPEILAGLGSVALLYHLVGRRFGASAGLLAALAMAITPVVVATDRNNTIDSLLIFTLLLAAWAFLLASERGQLRLLLLGAALVGLGFNIKMLQAFLPLPAFYALYLLGARVGLWRKLAHLALASLLLLTIALSWAVAVDLVPADQRPFVGSSGDNSVLSLITGYNGAMRLLGRGGGGNRSDAVGPGGGATRPNGGMPPQGGSGGSGQSPSNRPGGQTPPTGTAGSPGQGGPNNRPSGQMPASDGELAGSAAAGMSQIGQTGLLRLVTPPLSKEVSWLLPVGLLSLGILALRRPHWPLEGPHQAALLWGGWLLTAAAFFSVAGFFHEYYLSMLAPPLAALVGIGGAQLWCLRADRPRLALGLLLLAGAATLALQLLTARAFVGTAWWLMPSLALFTLGLLLATQQARRHLADIGWAASGLALLILPAVWAGLTTLNPSSNQSLPSAYSGVASGPANNGAVEVDSRLLAFLQANTQGVRYLIAVPSSMQGSDYVLATQRPVLYMGGFMGQDSVLDAEGLARLVANDELRYIYWGGERRGGQSSITEWIDGNCQVVEGFATQTRNMGAPGGTAALPSDIALLAGRGGGIGGFQIQLYDCGHE